jgi:hypothetical protein
MAKNNSVERQFVDAFESAKDGVGRAVIKCVSEAFSNESKMTKNDLQKLLLMINASLDETSSKAVNHYQKQVAAEKKAAQQQAKKK